MKKTLIGKFVAGSIVLAFLAGASIVCLDRPVFAAKDKVRIMWLNDLTGPYAGIHSQIASGIEAFVDWANEKEYIPGVELVVDIYDHGMDIGKAIAAFNVGLSKNPRPVISTAGLTTPTALALKPLAKREKIPLIDGASARPILVPPGWVVTTNTCYEGQFCGTGKWIADNWKEDSKVDFIRRKYENRKPRYAIIGWDNAFGRSFDQKETRAYLKHIGVDFIGAEYIPMSPTDTTPQLLRLREKGMDFAFMVMYPNAGAVVLKDSAKLGMEKSYMQIGFQIYSLKDIKKYVGDLGNGVGMLSGYAFDPAYLPPGLQKRYAKLKGKTDIQSFTGAITYLDTMSEVIRRTIKRVGIKKLTGEECWKTMMTNFKGYHPHGYLSPMTFGPKRLIGPDRMYLLQLQDGEINVLQKDVYTPDLLPGGRDVVK